MKTLHFLLRLCATLSSFAYTIAYNEVSAQDGYQQQKIDGITYGIFQANPAYVSLHWLDSGGQPYRRLSHLKAALEAENRHVLMLMNAGIFTKRKTPAGLWIERGKTLKALNRNSGAGNFHIQPNGVLWIEAGNAHISTTDAYARLNPHPDYAVQSGPMLLIDGQISSRFIAGLSSPYSRNAACITRTGALRFILTEHFHDEWPSFYRFAHALQTLDCQQALYLDGSISDWYVAKVSSTFHWSDFVGMIAITTAN